MNNINHSYQFSIKNYFPCIKIHIIKKKQLRRMLLRFFYHLPDEEYYYVCFLFIIRKGIRQKGFQKRIWNQRDFRIFFHIDLCSVCTCKISVDNWCHKKICKFHSLMHFQEICHIEAINVSPS